LQLSRTRQLRGEDEVAQLALLYLGVAEKLPTCERANGTMNTAFVIVPTFNLSRHEVVLLRSTLARHSCIVVAASARDFLRHFTGFEQKETDQELFSIGVVLNDERANETTQFLQAVLAVPGDKFNELKILILERNPFFSVLNSGSEALLSRTKHAENLGKYLTSEVALAETRAQEIRRAIIGNHLTGEVALVDRASQKTDRTFLREKNGVLSSDVLLGELNPSVASIQYCELFCVAYCMPLQNLKDGKICQLLDHWMWKHLGKVNYQNQVHSQALGAGCTVFWVYLRRHWTCLMAFRSARIVHQQR